jgi:ubiquinone/menaquinone biosynthesis C-methylase UbiE
MDIKMNINRSRQVFDQELHTPTFDQVIADDDQLAALIKMMDIQPGKRYLDLATGIGYIAFELAQKYKDIHVTGLDITPNSIQLNRIRQQQSGINNLDFITFDGIQFSFEDHRFYGVANRYAFHHFPDPEASIKEINRILLPGGFFLISDPATVEEDALSFIDEFQAFKPDGHVHYYKQAELITLLEKFGFKAESSFSSHISYPRVLNADYDRLLEATPLSIQQKYGVKKSGQQVFVTIPVVNILFRKQMGSMQST